MLSPANRVVLLAGWNEQSRLMRTFSEGRNGIDGLAAYGFDCTIFEVSGDLTMRGQIDAFAAFLERLRAREPSAFPLATLGYSAGGLVSRGFLRAYPDRVDEIGATVQIGAPNGGLVTQYALATLRIARVPIHVLGDLDSRSPFMAWLNGVSGAWVGDPDNPTKRRWRLAGPPWVMPPGHAYLHVVGRMPKYGLQSDGVVMIESATLDGAMRCVTIDDDAANHLNLGAVSNALATFTRRFRHDDEVWPRCVELVARCLRLEPVR